MRTSSYGNIDAVFGDGMHLLFWLTCVDSVNCYHFADSHDIASEHLSTVLVVAAKLNSTALIAAFEYAPHEISAKYTFAKFYTPLLPVSFYLSFKVKSWCDNAH